jgi:hypothetical protein
MPKINIKFITFLFAVPCAETNRTDRTIHERDRWGGQERGLERPTDPSPLPPFAEAGRQTLALATSDARPEDDTQGGGGLASTLRSIIKPCSAAASIELPRLAHPQQKARTILLVLRTTRSMWMNIFHSLKK